MNVIRRVARNVEYFSLGFIVGTLLWEYLDSAEREGARS